MTTLQTSRSATSVPSQHHHHNLDDSSGIDYSPSSSISNLKQKLIQSATKSYSSSSNSNNSLLNPPTINNNSFTHSTPSTHASGSSSSGDSGLDLSPNSLNNSSSNSNVNNIINNFTNLNLSAPSNVIGSSSGGGGIHSINGNHVLTGSSSMLGHANSDKYGGSNVGSENKCLRCGNMVYALERIGPIKGNIYHKTCFKCLICDRQLDLKTYYTNQIDLNERQIYCQSHAPKSGKGVFGADNLHIQNILNGPKLDVMQKVDNKPKANIDGSAKHIAHAMHAQHLVHNRKDPSQIHRFPAFPLMNPVKIKAREELRKAQQALEAKQREEEDRLLQQFMQERAQEEKKLEKEVKEEWEKRLQQIHIQYEQDLKRKKDQKDQRDLTHRLRKEKEELEKNMTLKRERKREDAKRALQQMEQEATAHLVTKHSEEMIKLIKAKEAEVEATFEPDEQNLNHMMTSNSISLDLLTQQTSNGHSNINELILGSNGGHSNSFATPPPPRPPLRRKRDLYDDPVIFQYIDERAINVAESEQTSYTELVDQLTYGLATDLEKTRSIFRWITVKDLNSIEFGDSLTADTPLGLLRGIKFGTETYHTLFMRLCSYAGMHCVDIKGHSKSVGYEPGMKIQPGKFTNTWNAVLIDGEWRFVQCNWGARHLVMSKDKKATEQQQQQQQQVPSSASNNNNLSKTSRDKIKYQYDEHYFLPDPEEFILEFFPHNPEWQLLEQPITLEEFESLPFVRSLFFHYHLDFVNQRQAVIHTNSRGACDIKLRMPDDLKARLAFHFHLRLSNKEDSEINGVKLERYVLHTIQDDLVSFNVHVPQTGEYFIEIFASLVEPESNPFGQTFKLKCVCKYKIACEELTQRMHPLPACASGEWGPMKAARHFNIQPLTHKSAIIESQSHLIEMKFELPKLLKIHGKLHNNVLSDLDKFVKHDVNQTNNQMTLYIQLPDEGQFGLDVYVRDPEYQSEKRTMSHCCKYLINFNKKTASSYNSNNSNTQAVTTIPIMNNNTSLYNGNGVTSPPPVKLSSPPVVVPVSNSVMVNSPPPPASTANVQINEHNNLMIGPNTELLNSLGMTPLNYASEPVIRVDDLSATQLDLQFKMSKAVDFSFDLKYSSSSSSSQEPYGSASSSSSTSSKHSSSSLSAPSFTQLKSTEIVNVKQYGYMIYFLLSLPAHKYGNYLFTVYASDDQSKTKTLPAVFTYLIKYEKVPFKSAATLATSNGSRSAK